MGRVMTDSTTPLSAANLNKYMAADGELGYGCVALWIKYNGSAWEASSARGTTGQYSNVSFNWSTNKLEIDISGLTNAFSTAPLVVASPTVGSTMRVEAHATSTSNIDVYFYAYDSGTVTSTESTSMSFNIIMVGNIT